MSATVGFVAPRKESTLHAAARGFLALRLRRQSNRDTAQLREPRAVGTRLVPIDANHGLLIGVEAWLVEPLRRRGGGVREITPIRSVGDRGDGHLERTDKHTVRRPFVVTAIRRSHEESALRDRYAIEH